jgi:pimeloyl-ACP methyl ester carboxylesterase
MIKTANARLEVVLQGENGPWIVMLPAGGRGADDFNLLGDELAKAGWQSAAVNPRGAGNSQGPLQNLTLHDYAEDVAGVIEALDGTPAVVLGHAWGNRVARCMAADYPAKACCVILLAAGGKVPMAPEVVEAMRRLRDGLTGQEVLTALKTAFFAEASDPSAWATGFWSDAVRASKIAAESTPLGDWWSGGEAPALVIQGKEDRCALPQNGYLLKSQFGDRITVVDIDHAAHALLPEQPELIAGIIIKYLEELGPDHTERPIVEDLC